MFNFQNYTQSSSKRESAAEMYLNFKLDKYKLWS